MSWRSKSDRRAGELTFCRRQLPGEPCFTVLSSKTVDRHARRRRPGLIVVPTGRRVV